MVVGGLLTPACLSAPDAMTDWPREVFEVSSEASKESWMGMLGCSILELESFPDILGNGVRLPRIFLLILRACVAWMHSLRTLIGRTHVKDALVSMAR